MTVRDLIRLYDYGYWATGRLLATVSELSADEFTRVVAGGHGSVRNTMVHILSAEWGWLERCGGHPRGPALAPEDFPNAGALAETWRRVEAWVRGFLETLTDEALERPVTYRNPRGEARSMLLGELLEHVVVHGIHHRGQVALLVRALGHAPAPVDLLLHYAERRGVSAW